MCGPRRSSRRSTRRFAIATCRRSSEAGNASLLPPESDARVEHHVQPFEPQVTNIARHYWPNQDAIGKRFRLSGAAISWIEIVGVEKTSKYTFLAERPTEA